tara:strand:- start:1712 stop:2068 length:357 start_codon:yes stop_codon:yes gene_type:complete
MSPFPFSDVGRIDIPAFGSFYTKKEVDKLVQKAVADAVAEAQRIDEESMRKHNRDATIISMILGFTALALFVDGLLRLLGIIPPFMEIDIDILDKVIDEVERDLLDKLQVPVKTLFNR